MAAYDEMRQLALATTQMMKAHHTVQAIEKELEEAKATRRVAIRNVLEKGTSKTEVGRMLGMSRQNVQQMLGAGRGPSSDLWAVGQDRP